MSRFLAVDYGTKRIGLAIGDDVTYVASPIKTIAGCGDVRSDAAAVEAYAGEYDVDGIVIGLPLNMDDTEGPQAKMVRTFGEALNEMTDHTIHYVDERLSSFAAEELIRPAGLTRKKKRAGVDRVAAQVILQSFFDARRNHD